MMSLNLFGLAVGIVSYHLGVNKMFEMHLQKQLFKALRVGHPHVFHAGVAKN